MNYGKKKMMYGGMAKKKKMREGGMTRKARRKDNALDKRVGKLADNYMKEAFPSAPRRSVEDFKKERAALMKKMKGSMKTGKIEGLTGGTKRSGMKEGGMSRMKPAKPADKMKPVDKSKNPGLSKLPTEVRNKMGFMKKGGDVKKGVTEGMKKAGKKAGELGAAIAKVKKKQAKDKSPKGFRGDPNKDGTFKKGGMAKKKMMGGGMAMKYKHGGKVGKKCPRDGIAMKGKTRA